MTPTPVHSIDDVISALDEIVDRSRRLRSRQGYFAALYRRVTIKIKQEIADGHFDDGQRMERLDVIFAARYLDAYWDYQRGAEVSQSWQLALDVSQRYWPIVLQHLLLGINAHINLDLGIAAAQTVDPGQLNSLRSDFDRINGILASLVGDVEDQLNQVWPLTKAFGHLLGSLDDRIINFSLRVARDEAWRRAEALSEMNEQEAKRYVQEVDRHVQNLGQIIYHPGPWLTLSAGLIRLGETQDVVKVIDILA